MRRLTLYTLLILTIASCGSNEFSDPNVVANNFLKNYITMNYADAKKYTSEAMHPTLDKYESDKNLMDEAVIEEHKTAVAEIVSSSVEEENGVAFFSFRNSKGADVVDELELHKEENKWLVTKLERTADVKLDEKFSDDFIDDLEQEAEEQDEIIPIEE